MDLGLRGRTAIVTGGSQGLGLAIAGGLAAEGANLVLNARDPERLHAAATELERESGVGVVTVAGDVRDEDLPERLVQAALGEHGRLDILVTNSGGPPKGRHDQIDAKAIHTALELTVASAMRTVLAVLGPMREAGWGRVIAVTSVSAKQPIPGLLLSNVTRPGLLGFIKSLSGELAADGVLCNAVAPGWTATPPVVGWLEEDEAGGRSADEKRAALLSEIPLGRIAEPAEIADAVVYLASERASYVTGQTLAVDGGYVKGLL